MTKKTSAINNHLSNAFNGTHSKRDFGIYVVFVIIFSYVTFASKPGKVQFYITSLAKDQFGGDSLNNVGSVDDLWDWLNDAVENKLYPQTDYDGATLNTKVRLQLMGIGRIIGGIRLRQVRATDGPCKSIPNAMKLISGSNTNCTRVFSPSTKSTIPMGSGAFADGNFTLPFYYQTTEFLNVSSWLWQAGKYGSYPNNGYNLDLVPNISPDKLALVVQNCRLYLEAGINECMKDQGIASRELSSPPPPPNIRPPPPPLAAGIRVSYDNTGPPMDFISLTTNMTAPTGVDAGKQLTFYVRNTAASATDIPWSFDPATQQLLRDKTWIKAPLNSGRVAGVSNTQPAGGADPVGVTVFWSPQFVNRTAPASEVLTITGNGVSVTVQITVTFPGSPARRRLQQEGEGADVSAWDLSSPNTVSRFGYTGERRANQHQSFRTRTLKEAGNASCAENNPVSLPPSLDLDSCTAVCPYLPYVGFRDLLALSGDDQCGLCKCQDDTNTNCTASCSSKSLASMQIANLKGNNWIDNSTRAVIMDFAIFHPDFNLFSSIKILFELPPFGAVVGKPIVRTVKLYRYVTGYDKIVMGMEVIFIILVAWYTVEEGLEIWQQGFLDYCKNLWNILDWTVLCVFYTAIILRYLGLAKLNSFKFDQLDTKYIDFVTPSFTATQELNVSSIAIFLIYFKFFKYASVAPRMDAILATISRAAFDLMLFSVAAAVVQFGFGTAFYVSFGAEIERFATLGDACGSLTRALLGDFDYPALYEANKYMAPLLFYSYFTVVFFILLNMFLAIVNDSYAEIKAEQSQDDLLFYYRLGLKITGWFQKRVDFLRTIFRSRGVSVVGKKEGRSSEGGDEDGRGGGDEENEWAETIDKTELAKALRDNPRAYELVTAGGWPQGPLALLRKYGASADGVTNKEEMTALLKQLAERQAEEEAQNDTQPGSVLSGIRQPAGLGHKEDTPPRKRSSDSHNDPRHFSRVNETLASAADVAMLDARIDRLEGHLKDMSRNMAKKLSLMIDLTMSLSDQIHASTIAAAAAAGNMDNSSNPTPPPNMSPT